MCDDLLRRVLVAVVALFALFATRDATASEQCVQEIASGLHEPMASITSEPSDGLRIEGEIAPISLSEGASAIAPRTIHGIGDAVIQAGRACERAAAGIAGWVGPDDEREKRPNDITLDGCLAGSRDDKLPSAARTTFGAAPPLATPGGVIRVLERPPRA
jgi:hypothetical protein